MSTGSDASASMTAPGFQRAQETPIKRCWGCNTLNTLSEQQWSIVKCGWCGCILSQGHHKDKTDTDRPRRRPSQLTSYHRFVPLGVIIFIFTVTVIAVNVFLNPLLGSSHWYYGHCIWSLYLFLNVIFHYAGATLQVPDVQSMPVGQVPQMSLDGCTLCSSCQAPKPCRTHHCRICKRCVPECCHHCIFLGQCVGAHNLRHFLLFLVFTIVGCCYILLLAAVLLQQRWPAIVEFWRYESPNLFPAHWWKAAGLLSYQARMLWSAPTWLSLAVWDMLAVLNSGIGLSALLLRQLKFVLSGRGYIDRMQGRPSLHQMHEAHELWMYQLHKTFAFEPALYWLRPAWRYPVAHAKRAT